MFRVFIDNAVKQINLLEGITEDLKVGFIIECIEFGRATVFVSTGCVGDLLVYRGRCFDGAYQLTNKLQKMAPAFPSTNLLTST